MIKFNFYYSLKQMEDRGEKLKRDAHEMNKPLARYADDKDLEDELKDRERDDDPMLAYIKEKRVREGKAAPGIFGLVTEK